MNKWAAVCTRRAALGLAIALMTFATNGVSRAAEPPSIVACAWASTAGTELARWTPVEVTFSAAPMRSPVRCD